MRHLDEGTLHALVDGEIPSSDLPPLQAHLASCASCRAALDEARALAGETRDLVETIEVPVGAPRHLATGDAIRARPPRSVPWHRLAWAATVVAAVGLGYGARDLLPPPAAPTEVVTPAARDNLEASTPSPAERPADVPEQAGRVAAKEEATPPSEPEASLPPPPPRSRAQAPKATEPPAAPIPAPRVRGGIAAGLVGSPPPDVSALPEVRREAPVPDASPVLRARKSASADDSSVTLDEAMRWSTGRLRLLPDLIPAGLSRRGDTLQITYLLGTRVVVLEEIFHPDTVLLRLRAAADFPVDSLAALRARLP